MTQSIMRIYIVVGCSYIIAGCIIAILAFYESYYAASRTQKASQWRPLLVKSVKLAGAILLLLVLFTISQELCKHYQISFVISLMISVLLSLCFLGLCYKFKLSLNDFTQEKSKESKNKELLNNLKKEVKGS